jgi:hypothetical protein
VTSRSVRSIATCLGVLLLVGLGFAAFRSGGRTSTDDRNGDGRPDVWRTYDADGQLVEVAVDSNFDGRSDVREIYAGGTLVRRESDRNFDDRVDLVEDFDATTHERVRSTVDVNFDGTADLQVLFRDGHPVYSSWAIDRRDLVSRDRVALPAAAERAAAHGPLLAWDDPFSSEANLRTPIALAVHAPAALIVSTPALHAVSGDRGSVARGSFVGSSTRPRARSLSIRNPRAPPLA